jgi:hypothetical protein
MRSRLIIDIIRYCVKFEIVYFGRYTDVGCEWDYFVQWQESELEDQDQRYLG